MDYPAKVDKPLLNKIISTINSSLPFEDEYAAIVQINHLVSCIHQDSNYILNKLKALYSVKFPELSSFNLSAADYSQLVIASRNEVDLVKVDLSFLPPATSMAIAVTASTTAGRPLSDKEMEEALEYAHTIQDLGKKRAELLSYIENRMCVVAPNTSNLVGSRIAAQLVGAAGGITALSRIPACNLQVLNDPSLSSSVSEARKSSSLTGFSSIQSNKHEGFIANCQLVQQAPDPLKIKAQRLVATKCAIAARLDAQRESKDGTVGASLRLEIQKKLEKLNEPPPITKEKPLPVPDDGPKTKRGGRRMRKLKEIYQITQLRKQQNRIEFGVSEKESIVNSTVKGLGTVGVSGSVRAPSTVTIKKNSSAIQTNLPQKRLLNPFDDRKLSAPAYQPSNMEAASKMPSIPSSNLSGTVSTVSFTAVQGLELFNPNLLENNLKTPKERYFKDLTSFK